MYHLKLQQQQQQQQQNQDLILEAEEEHHQDIDLEEEEEEINDALLSTNYPTTIKPTTYATIRKTCPPLTSISNTSTTISSSSSSTLLIGKPTTTFGNIMTSDLNGIATVAHEHANPYNYAESDIMQHDGETLTRHKLTTTATFGGGVVGTIEDKLKLLSAIKAEPSLLHDITPSDIILKSTTNNTVNNKLNKNRHNKGDNNVKYNNNNSNSHDLIVGNVCENMVTDLSLTKLPPTANASTDAGIPMTTTTSTLSGASSSSSSTTIPMYIDVNDQHLSNLSRINLTIESKIMETSTPLSATSMNMRPFAGNLVVVSGSDSSDSTSNGHNTGATFDASKRPRLESPKHWIPESSPGGASSSAPPLSPSTASQSQSFGASMTNEYASPLSAGSYDAFSPGGRTGRDDLSPSSSLNGYATNENCEAKKSKKGPAPRLQEELCLVCGDRASGYHYNALTCEGCKGFFRRSVTKNANYCCKFGHACEMDMYMRRKCQECRLKKCLAVGMRPECVVPENQCAMKRREKKAQKEKDKQHSSPMSNASDIVKKEILDLMTCEPPTHPTFPLLPEDILAKCQARNIPALTHNQLSVIYKLIWYQDGYEQPSEEDLKRIMNTPDENESQHDMSFRHITEITILTVQLIVEFAKGLPAFTRIPQEDQITLLKACSSEVMMLRMARRYDHSTDSIFFANNRSYNRDTYKMAGVADNIEDLLHFCRQMYAMKVDNVEYALLTAIVIFSDRPALEEAELVEAIQSYYIDTLRIYILNRHCGDPKTIVFFAKLLSILTELRTLGNQNAEMCFSLKLKNRKLPKFLEEIWDVHTIPPSVQSHIQSSVQAKPKHNEAQHPHAHTHAHAHAHAQAHSHHNNSSSSSSSSSSTGSNNNINNSGQQQHGLASTSADVQQQQGGIGLHNIKIESSPSIAPTSMSISSDGSPGGLNGSEYSDVSPGMPLMGLVMDQDSMLGGDSGTAA